jgi:2-desacetyl-2-hydroxyethyl bacteriochlorophyllide A dehydrogenase
MKTVILETPGQLRTADTEAPNEIPPGHAMVRVGRVGVCGTDWHAFRGKQPFFAYPRILGHEVGVVIERVNDPASGLEPGDRCAVEPYLNCGHCIACRRGKSNCCTDLKVLGVHVDGGMRERFVVPVNKLHPSTKLSLDQLALVEPLGIGCHAVERAAIEVGESVLIIGAGPIGISVITFAEAAGARLIVMDISDTRLSFCRDQIKVQHTINATSADPLERLKELTDGDLPTLVIDATGNPQSMMRCFDLAAPGGRIVFVGLFQGEVTFKDPNFHRRELTLLASRNARPEDFQRIIRLVEDGSVDTGMWITHRTTPENLPDEFPRWLAPDSGVLKAMIEF